jgi:hypothetical protein
MYARIAKITTENSDDWELIPNFVHELRTNSMYRFIIEDLMARPGFIKKEHTLCEDNTGQTFFSTINFDTKENFDSYINEEANQSIWIYLELTAQQKGLIITIEDKEV